MIYSGLNRYYRDLGCILCLSCLAIACTLFFPHIAAAEECEENEDYKILLCGDWTKLEINELMTFLIEDGEIAKITKQGENYYLLHTCDERNDGNVCIKGFVHVIERVDRDLTIRPEGWDWFLP